MTGRGGGVCAGLGKRGSFQVCWEDGIDCKKGPGIVHCATAASVGAGGQLLPLWLIGKTGG